MTINEIKPNMTLWTAEGELVQVVYVDELAYRVDTLTGSRSVVYTRDTIHLLRRRMPRGRTARVAR